MLSQFSENAVVGLDVGRRFSCVCVLEEGKPLLKRRLRTLRTEFEAFFSELRFARIVFEAGCGSAWIERCLKDLSQNPIVLDSRRSGLKDLVRNKTDESDAEALAKLALTPHLLHAVYHVPLEVEDDRALLSVRAQLVGHRTAMVNQLRGLCAARGIALPWRCSPEALPKHAWPVIPEGLKPAAGYLLKHLVTLNRQIKDIENSLTALVNTRYAATMKCLQQVHGVGPVIALSFILTIHDPHRFPKNRQVAAYLGLVPKVRRSGDANPQLGITKAGDREMRRLLVQGAYVLMGARAPDSDLKRYGLALCARGGKSAKKRAAVAVARRLAVLLNALWKSSATWQPLRLSAAA